MTNSPRILTDVQATHKQMGAQPGQRRTRINSLVKINICVVKSTAREVKRDSKRRKCLSPVTSATTLVWGWPGKQGREWQWRVEASSPVWISLPSWPERNLQASELCLASIAHRLGSWGKVGAYWLSSGSLISSFSSSSLTHLVDRALQLLGQVWERSSSNSWPSSWFR